MYTSTSSSFVSISKKAIFAGLISATVAGATLIGAASPALASTRGWIHEGNTWSYQVSKDTYAKGWYYTPSGKWFYFNKDTYQMVTGKLTDDNKDYWLDENAGLLYDRWVQDAKGNWLHTDDNGVLVTGWFKTKSGYWFYFNQDHTMKTGILTDKGYTYWLDKNDGLLYNEWVKDESGKWLHTDGNGCLVKGWYQTLYNEKWWYFNDDYKLATGKVTDKGFDYWVDASQGVVYDSWVQDAQGNWLYADKWSFLVKGWYHAPNGKWFYFNKDNYQMVTGKLTDDNKDYWLDENAGLLYDRWVQDAKGNWLHTDDNGVLVTGWFKTKSGYWFYFNQDHTMKTGILTDKGYTYWLDKNDGLLYNEWVKDESGKWLHTDGNGCLVKGWYQTLYNEKWWYFNDDYKLATGKVTDKGFDYWLDENAGLLYDRWVQDAKGNWLHTDDNGVLVTGWFKTKSGYWFYFNQDHTMKTGILTDKGYTYWLDKNDGLLYNEWVKDESGKWLHTDGNGCLLTGWYHAPNGKWFYFNDDYTLRTDPLVEKGKRYYFDVNMGLIRTEPLTQGSESANKPSSSSTGRGLGTDKNHKPCGAARWVVDKPAQTVKVTHLELRCMNGHSVVRESCDPKDFELVTNWKEFNDWKEHKNEMMPDFQKMTEEEALRYYSKPKIVWDQLKEVAEYDRTHKFKPGEPANWIPNDFTYEKTIPEQGHWE